MPRGYRRIILAAVFGLAVAAHGANDRHLPKPATGADQGQTTRQIEETGHEIAAAINRGADPGKYQRTCEGDRDDRQSDLCAQWTAADAAKDAALFTARAFWAAVVAAILGGAALLYTIKGTRAAIEGVEAQIASDRPLVQASWFKFLPPENGTILETGKYRFSWCVQNHGATGCMIEKVWISFDSSAPTSNTRVHESSSLTVIGFIAAGKGLNTPDAKAQTYDIDPKEAEKIVAAKRAFFVGKTQYRDMGGRRFTTGFCGWVDVDENMLGSGFHPFPSEHLWNDQMVPAQNTKRWYQKRFHWN